MNEEHETQPSLLKLLLGEWQYISEGNANIVLRSVADPTSPGSAHNGRVLRIAKASIPESSATAMAYARDIVAPLFGRQYVDLDHEVTLRDSEVQQLLAEIAAHRAPGRLASTDESGLRSEGAVVTRDKTSMWLPTADISSSSSSSSSASSVLTLEIKPKLGASPRSLLVPQGHSRLKYSIDRYTALQRYKMHMQAQGEGVPWGSMQSVGEYKPVQFFTGGVKGLEQSLIALIQCPQNKLKVFVNGALVPLNHSSAATTDDAANDIEQQQQQQQQQKSNEQPTSSYTAVAAAASSTLGITAEALSTTVAHVLHAEPLISNILATQQLDILEVDGAVIVYNRLLQLCANNEQTVNTLLQQAAVGNGWSVNHSDCVQRFEHLQDVLYTDEPHTLSEAELNTKHVAACEAVNTLLSTDDCVLLLTLWALAQAAADCSIMLSLSKRTAEGDSVRTKSISATSDNYSTAAAAAVVGASASDGNMLQSSECAGQIGDISYCLCAVDVGPKPSNQLQKQQKREPQIWQAVAAHMSL
jgi:Inositol-pentakisphosphate 2-kinase